MGEWAGLGVVIGLIVALMWRTSRGRRIGQVSISYHGGPLAGTTTTVASGVAVGDLLPGEGMVGGRRPAVEYEVTEVDTTSASAVATWRGR